MKINLNKKDIKNLSLNKKTLAENVTPKIAGASGGGGCGGSGYPSCFKVR